LDAVCVYVACQYDERIGEIERGSSDVKYSDYGERGSDADESHTAAEADAEPDGVDRGTGILVYFGEEAMIKSVSILKKLSKGYTLKMEWLYREQMHRSSAS